MKPRRTLISAAVALAIAAGPAHAVLERLGPVDKSPTIGGFPAWAQDRTGITLDFCDLKSQAELDGGWCVLIPLTVASASSRQPITSWRSPAMFTTSTTRSKRIRENG